MEYKVKEKSVDLMNNTYIIVIGVNDVFLAEKVKIMLTPLSKVTPPIDVKNEGSDLICSISRKVKGGENILENKICHILTHINII